VAATSEHIRSDDWMVHQVVFGCAEHPDAAICTYLVPSDVQVERLGTRPDAALHIPGFLEQTE
jgi:hypothetical protein